MIRTLNFCLTLLALFLTTFCMAQKSELKFNKDGKFKIVQFTDVHFKYGNPASDVAQLTTPPTASFTSNRKDFTPFSGSAKLIFDEEELPAKSYDAIFS